MTKIRILYDGKLALTISQAADRYGYELVTMRTVLRRLDVQPLPEPLDARTPLYSAAALDKAMKNRPGRGANLRKGENR